MQANDPFKNRSFRELMDTFPKMGRSTDPHVSAPQWTSPDAKSAVSIPATERESEEESSTGKGWENSQHLFGLKKNSKTDDNTTPEHCPTFQSVLTNAQQDVPQMSQMEIGK